MTSNQDSNQQKLEELGFSFSKGGAHSARTIMLDELTELFAVVDAAAPTAAYKQAVVEDNCLRKRSERTRLLTFRHLSDLYALDPQVALFRSLRSLWDKDEAARPMLALLCALTRDAVLSQTVPYILSQSEGSIVGREPVEAWVSAQMPDRFSAATLKSTAQNINSSLTKSGHLTGRKKKTRTRAEPTAGAIVYALLLGYLRGERGPLLFQTEYVKALDCGRDKAMDLARDAGIKGWMIFKQIGDVVEVRFPNLLTDADMAAG